MHITTIMRTCNPRAFAPFSIQKLVIERYVKVSDADIENAYCTGPVCCQYSSRAMPAGQDRTTTSQPAQNANPLPTMRKLMFSPRSNKLTRNKESNSRPGSAESTASRASEDSARSPRPSLSSPSPGTVNPRSAAPTSMPLLDAKLHQAQLSERPSTSQPNGTSNSAPKRMASIRPVSSFDDGPFFSNNTSLEASPSQTNGRSDSGLSSSPQSQTSVGLPPLEKRTSDHNGTEKLPAGRLRPRISAQYLRSVSNDARDRSISPNTQHRPINYDRPIDTSQRETSFGAKMADGAGDVDASSAKAGPGKTGRVMNRLISENEALKRDLQIEKLNSEESKREAKLLQDKMERMIADYESRLLEANVTKTLLARKERQVESLQSAVDLEKKRTTEAQSKERTWRDEMEKTRDESTRKVEEATTQAALLEGRYNAISSHWKDQGEEVKRALTKMGKEIAELLDARRKDDEKITTLRDLCDQQDGNIKELLQQKETLWRQFEQYKKEQEGALSHIKSSGVEREAQQQQMLIEAKEVVDKLKWALNVKSKIDWAQ
ncbi:hypothetical protein BD289DRAFT_452067 [Coniella lustricola]|uniref:SWI5-dependent HO expression protein 3 n=1 Tax=Coniella lustricola TaxID=2025994 RepID=A0A2T3ACH4_9PEZI|nr:hypothetical protein BD289DRAFT_452067 [Coniella lustricola]